MLTVIIPTRNRSKLLSNLILSFSTIRKKNFYWEVLVIDNASDDNTKDIVNNLSSKVNFKIKYFFEKKIGLHYARNTGVREANSPFLAFLDDDMVVTSTWLDRFALLKDNMTDAYVGRILPIWESNPPLWLKLLTFTGTYPYLGLLNLGDNEIEIDPLYLYGGNLFIKKSIIVKLKGFNPDSFPQKSIKFRGDGESGLMKKFKLANYRSLYLPSATAYHIISRNRITIKYLCQRAYNEGISNSFSSIRDPKKKEEFIFWFLKKLFGFNFIRSMTFSKILQFIIADIFLFFIQIKIKNSLRDGFNFHQKEIKKDKKLLSYVLNKNFLND
jgi:glycosyltransferase involved in cell wall biosynthesis